MNKLSAVLVCLTLGFFSCNNAVKNSKKLDLAKSFFTALDHSNSNEATELISDKFKTIDDGFEQEYNGFEFAEWVKWDSVFQPSYQILKLKEKNGIVTAMISKTDKRITFLHQDPIITEEFIQFEGNKIRSIERNSVSFNVERFVTSRDELVNWIEEHHPEINGFLNDQTKNGGMNYLRAIDLYRNKDN